MELAAWTDLEVLSRKLADSQGRLARARSTQNHGLIRVLEKEIAATESLRDRMVSHIAARLTSSPAPAVQPDPPASEISSAPIQPAPPTGRLEGGDTVWNQLNRADLEGIKRDLDARRSELLARHAEELKALDADKAEIDILEQAIDSIARKFNITGAEVISLERASLSQAG